MEEETVEVVVLTRQMYNVKMYNPGDTFTCHSDEANALIALDQVRRKTAEDPPAGKSGRHHRRDMRAEA
jgi:hypothetical protein